MIWSIYDINTLTEKEYFQWYRMMSAEKKARVNRLLSEDNRKRTVAADHLARQLIAEWCKLRPEEIRFTTDEHGKPHAVNLSVHFSVSHSKNYVFCVVSDRPIGADIEVIRPINLKASRWFCTENEQNYISADTVRFFEIWTAKEARAKQIGIGLAAMNTFCFSEIKDRLHTVRTKDYFLSIII